MTAEKRPELFKFIWGILQKRNCHLYRINGIEDHLHIVVHLHPSIALADLVKEIKVASAIYIKEQKLFPEFETWQIGYGAFTYSIGAKHNLIRYVKNQEAHHRKKTSREEMIDLLKEHNIEYDEKYLE